MSTIHAPARSTKAFAGPPPRVLVIQAPYYDKVVGGMLYGAEQVFVEVGVRHQVIDVAGAYELPAALRMAIQQTAEHYDGYLLVGCVVRGETDHYDYVCGEAARGLMDVSLETGVPCGFGLLTVDSMDQAVARAGGDKRDSGRHAAEAVLAQVRLARRLDD